MKKYIIGFIFGIILSGTVVFAVTSINANEIQYDSTHTVKDKIDDLYNIATNYKNLSQTTTVASNKMLNGFTAYDNSGNLVTGNIPTYNGTTIFNASYSNQTATTAGKYVADDIVINGMASTYKNLTETTDVTGSALLYNVVAYNSSGQTVTGSIETYSGSTNITPTTTSQTLTTNGKYLSNDITVNAIPSSYKNLSTTTTATASDIANGKTAYGSDGTLITGDNTQIQELESYKTLTIPFVLESIATTSQNRAIANSNFSSLGSKYKYITLKSKSLNSYCSTYNYRLYNSNWNNYITPTVNQKYLISDYPIFYHNVYSTNSNNSCIVNIVIELSN